jgi:hypothetical protein
MSSLNVEYPLGRPVIPAVIVQRRRPLAPEAQIRVAQGEQVRPDSVLAIVPGSGEGQDSGGMLAGIGGRVTEIVPQRSITIEGPAAIFYGIAGLGGQAAGPLALLPRGELPTVVPIPRDCVIIFPQQLPLSFMQRAAAGGAAGIIAGSASARELEAFARADLTAVYDGLTVPPQKIGLTIVLTEGLGDTSMRPALYHMLAQRVNTPALIEGTTSPRRNVRPEIVLAIPPSTPPLSVPMESTLAAGARVFVAAGPQAGASGTITHVFNQRQPTYAGIQARAAVVRLDDGTTTVEQIAALDRIG